jgi:tRNA A-37 threonylcarbamoyl transferase component Bud32
MASSAPPPSSHAPSGELLAGRYQLDRRIGQGGMAEVWVANDIDLDRKVAVKWLRTNLASDPVVTERFRREAIAVARLTHPNIVAVHDVFVHDGRQAVVMQLVDGKSLRQLLDTQKRLGPELTIHIGAGIAGALDEAHRAGFVHRDVKPGNILVTSDGRVLLTDFGIAKGLTPGDDLTSDNVMMGTAKYLSPEQVRGRRLDGRADLYSLALVLYECLAGRVPFLGESDADTALARLQRDPTDLGHLRPTLPIGLVNLIHRTLARNPAHRPQTGNDLRSALLAVDTSPPAIDGTPAELPERLANPPKRALGAGPGNPGSPGLAGGVPIPGEPNVTTALPVTRSEGPVQRAARRTQVRTPGVDETPPADAPIRGRPARRDQQRFAPSLVVLGSLLLVALAVAGLLYIGINRGDDPAVVPQPTSAPGEQPTATVPPSAPVSAVASAGPVVGAPVATAAASDLRIVSIQAWDPDGDNGAENDSQAGLALADGSDSTSWPTECYANNLLNGKRGVGLILHLSSATTGTLRGESLNGPYQVDVLTSDAATAPTELDAWQRAGDTKSSDQPGSFEAVIETPATYVLVWLKELGRDEVCTEKNPYRGRLGEISFAP